MLAGKKYIYLQPKGGFNDVLRVLLNHIKWASLTNRTLLFDFFNSFYGVNFADYFNFPSDISHVIYDHHQIKKISLDRKLSLFPAQIKQFFPQIVSGEIFFLNEKYYNYGWMPYHRQRNGGSVKNVSAITSDSHPRELSLTDKTKKLSYELSLNPEKEKSQADIWFHLAGGGGGGALSSALFKRLIPSPLLLSHYKVLRKRLPSSYLAIHCRATDMMCDYPGLYQQHRDLIDSYKAIYVATDNLEVVRFFEQQDLNVFNFSDLTTLGRRPKVGRLAEPKGPPTLHTSSMDPERKMKDLLGDIYLVTQATQLISNSAGGFISFLRHLRKDGTRESL